MRIVIITKNNYDRYMKKLLDYNFSLSHEFLEMLDKLQVRNLNIASVGNSISAGYSKCDKILPFFIVEWLGKTFGERTTINGYKAFIVFKNTYIITDEEK